MRDVCAEGCSMQVILVCNHCYDHPRKIVEYDDFCRSYLPGAQSRRVVCDKCAGIVTYHKDVQEPKTLHEKAAIQTDSIGLN